MCPTTNLIDAYLVDPECLCFRGISDVAKAFVQPRSDLDDLILGLDDK